MTGLEYAIIKIAIAPTGDPEKDVKIYFVDEYDKELTDDFNERDIVDEWPLPIPGKNNQVKFLNGAIWYHGNPWICVWYDKKRI